MPYKLSYKKMFRFFETYTVITMEKINKSSPQIYEAKLNIQNYG